MKDIDDLVRNQLRRDADRVRFEPDRWEERLTSRRARPRTPHIRAIGTVIAALLLAVGIIVPLAGTALWTLLAFLLGALVGHYIWRFLVFFGRAMAEGFRRGYRG